MHINHVIDMELAITKQVLAPSAGKIVFDPVSYGVPLPYRASLPPYQP